MDSTDIVECFQVNILVICTVNVSALSGARWESLLEGATGGETGETEAGERWRATELRVDPPRRVHCLPLPGQYIYTSIFLNPNHICSTFFCISIQKRILILFRSSFSKYFSLNLCF